MNGRNIIRIIIKCKNNRFPRSCCNLIVMRKKFPNIEKYPLRRETPYSKVRKMDIWSRK